MNLPLSPNVHEAGPGLGKRLLFKAEETARHWSGQGKVGGVGALGENSGPRAGVQLLVHPSPVAEKGPSSVPLQPPCSHSAGEAVRAAHPSGMSPVFTYSLGASCSRKGKTAQGPLWSREQGLPIPKGLCLRITSVLASSTKMCQPSAPSWPSLAMGEVSSSWSGPDTSCRGSIS